MKLNDIGIFMDRVTVDFLQFVAKLLKFAF